MKYEVEKRERGYSLLILVPGIIGKKQEAKEREREEEREGRKNGPSSLHFKKKGS